MRIGNRTQACTIFNDLERPLTQILRSRHSLTLNMNVFLRQTAEGQTEQTIYTEITYTKMHMTQLTLQRICHKRYEMQLQ